MATTVVSAVGNVDDVIADQDRAQHPWPGRALSPAHSLRALSPRMPCFIRIEFTVGKRAVSADEKKAERAINVNNMMICKKIAGSQCNSFFLIKYT